MARTGLFQQTAFGPAVLSVLMYVLCLIGNWSAVSEATGVILQVILCITYLAVLVGVLFYLSRKFDRYDSFWQWGLMALLAIGPIVGANAGGASVHGIGFVLIGIHVFLAWPFCVILAMWKLIDKSD